MKICSRCLRGYLNLQDITEAKCRVRFQMSLILHCFSFDAMLKGITQHTTVVFIQPKCSALCLAALSGKRYCRILTLIHLVGGGNKVEKNTTLTQIQHSKWRKSECVWVHTSTGHITGFCFFLIYEYEGNISSHLSVVCGYGRKTLLRKCSGLLGNTVHANDHVEDKHCRLMSGWPCVHGTVMMQTKSEFAVQNQARWNRRIEKDYGWMNTIDIYLYLYSFYEIVFILNRILLLLFYLFSDEPAISLPSFSL